MRDDDAEGLIEAIRRLRRAAAVMPHVGEANDMTKSIRARTQFLSKIMVLFREDSEFLERNGIISLLASTCEVLASRKSHRSSLA